MTNEAAAHGPLVEKRPAREGQLTAGESRRVGQPKVPHHQDVDSAVGQNFVGHLHRASLDAQLPFRRRIKSQVALDIGEIRTLALNLPQHVDEVALGDP